MIIKYGTGCTIAVVVDEQFVDVESHSLMLVNWLNTSPSHFLCNPTFGVISTTERLFSKPQTGGGKIFFGNFSLAKMGWLDLLANISRDVVLATRFGNASKKIAILKQLKTHFKAKREKGVGTPFPRVPAPLHPLV